MSEAKRWTHHVTWDGELTIQATMMALKHDGEYVLASDYDQLKEKLWHSEMAATAEAHRVDELKAERDTLRKQLDEVLELLTGCQSFRDAEINAWLERNKQ